MGITRLKRLITEDLSRAFTTREFQKFCYRIHPNLDLYKLTGYPQNIILPIKEAAKQAVDYFYKTKKFIPFLDFLLHSALVGFKGEKVVFNNLKIILAEMKECGFEYNAELNKVVIADNRSSRNDWGFLEEGKLYNFCFISIDICGNSKLVRKYEGALIQKTYANFKKLIIKSIQKRNGRVWSWEGDGGLAAFHIQDFVNQAVLSSLDILTYMPVFNAVSNYLDENIRIRIGINAGTAEYKKNIEMISCEAINEVRMIEKSYTVPMTISISPRTIQYVDMLTRKSFENVIIKGKSVFQLKLPLHGGEIE